MFEQIQNYYFDNQVAIIRFLAVLVVGYIAIKLVVMLMNHSRVMSKMDPTMFGFLRGLAKFFLYSVYTITLLTSIGVEVTTFIAMLSAVGLAIALSLQGNLTNFASALVILISKPFKVGDFIESQGNMGTVKEIQLLFTHILTPDNRKIVIPNSDLVNTRIINYTSEQNRRVDLVFSASYKDDVEFVKSVITQVVNENELVLKDLDYVIRLGMHSPSSLDYDVKVWVHKDNYWAARYALQEDVRKAFQENHVSLPIPQRDIWMHDSK
jgi:small conductance mechanosensitive channel